MDIAYAVKWIESEFGQRDEGYKIFLDKELCIKVTREDSARGASYDGYLGPERPLVYFEVPAECVPADVLNQLETKPNGWAFTPNDWTPAFRSKPYRIT